MKVIYLIIALAVTLFITLSFNKPKERALNQNIPTQSSSQSSLTKIKEIKKSIPNKIASNQTESSKQKNSYNPVAKEISQEPREVQSDETSNPELLNQEVENIVGSQEIKPTFKEWKKLPSGKSYNIFVEEPAQNSFTPPSVPLLTSITIDGEKVNVAIPADKKSYIAVKKGESIEVQEIQKEEAKSAALIPTPPAIGK